MNQETPKEALNRYVELLSKIRLLSAPDIGTTKNPEDYRNLLIQNFTEIGELSNDIKDLLDSNIYPLLDSDDLLTPDQDALLSGFSKALVNNTAMEHLDPMLCFRIAIRLLSDAERKEDVGLLIRALDNVVDSAYIMMRFAFRLYPCSNNAYDYLCVGLQASERLLGFLDKDVFASLPDDESKEIVLVNSRYITALDFHNVLMGSGKNETSLEHLKTALALADDPYYTNAAPNYNWRRHRFLSHQYAMTLTERNNVCGLSAEMLEEVYEIFQDLKTLRNTDIDYYSTLCSDSTLALYEARISYLTGRIDAGEYKYRLRGIYEDADPLDYDIQGVLANVFVLEEYLLVISETEATSEDEDYLTVFYRRLATYLHKMPKIGIVSFGTNVMTDIIKDYVDVPNYSFTDFCTRLIAAIHPPTYVHTLTMSSLTSCLTMHLMRKHPELFMEFARCCSPDEVVYCEDAILGHAERASLFHDIGKLFVMEVVMMYGRKLDDEEFNLIRSHAEAGGEVLKKHRFSEQYHALATAHHFRFDELEEKASEGYFDHSEIPFIAVSICADGMDAGTDTVGRSYKSGKTMDEIISEFRAESGTRYAPYVVELFDDPRVVADVRKILEEERTNNYRKAFDTLFQISEDKGKRRGILRTRNYGTVIESLIENILEKQQFKDENVFDELNQLKSIAMELQDDTLLGFAHYHLADAHYYHDSDYDKFRSHLVSSIKHLSAGDDPEMLARAFNLLGVDACINGILDVAYHYFLTARRISSDLIRSPLVGIADSNLGRVFYLLGNYERAREHVRRSGQEMMPFSDDINFYHNIIDHFNDYGLVSLKLGDIESAKDNIAKIREYEKLARADGIDVDHFTSSSLEAQAAFADGDMQEGIRVTEKAIHLLSTQLYVIEYSDDLKDLCRCLMDEGLDEYVEQILNKISSTLENANVDKLNGILCDLNIEYYQKKGDKEMLLEYLLKKNSLTMRDTERNKVYLNAVDMIDSMEELRKAQSRMQNEHASLVATISEDPLTGVRNRYGMNRLLEDTFTTASETATQLCIIMIDIDHFKEYNDSYGHLKGDDCLKTIAMIISNVCEDHKAGCARYGGDEFIIIIEDATPERVSKIIEALDSKIADAAIPNLASRQGVITLSHGSYSGTPESIQDIWTFLHRADSELYSFREYKRRNGLY